MKDGSSNSVSVSEENSDNNDDQFKCESCGRQFKKRMAPKQHVKKCSSNPSEETKISSLTEEDLYNYPPEVIKAEFRCLKCALVFPDQKMADDHKPSCVVKVATDLPENSAKVNDVRTCKLCTGAFKITCDSEVSIKFHYVYAHYMGFIARLGKLKEFPVACLKAGCNKNLPDLRTAAFHYGIEHQRLFKALKNEKKAELHHLNLVFFKDMYEKKMESDENSVSLSNTLSSAPELSDADVDDQIKTSSQKSRNKRICPKCKKVPNESLKFHMTQHFQ